MVHLVEDDQRLDRGRAGGVQHRLAGDLRVGGDVALGAGAHRADGVGQARVQHDARGVGGVGPLQAQVVGRADDDDAGDLAPGEQPRGQRQGEGGLAGAGRRGDQEVLGGLLLVLGERGLLPRSERSARPLRAQGLRSQCTPHVGTHLHCPWRQHAQPDASRARPRSRRIGASQAADLRICESRGRRCGDPHAVRDRNVTPRRSRRSQPPRSPRRTGPGTSSGTHPRLPVRSLGVYGSAA